MPTHFRPFYAPPGRRLLAVVSAMLLGASGAIAPRPVAAQNVSSNTYDVGSPVLADIWVDAATGDDANTGATRAQALRTITAAWNRIPQGSTLAGTGYRIQIGAGTYAADAIPTYWESRHGTPTFPVILNAADGPRTATLANVNVFDCTCFYLMGLTVTARGGDVAHFERCQLLLIRDCTIAGTGDIATFDAPQEALKINQSSNVYVEGCDISGAWDNAVDCVAVQYGHFVRSRIHDSGDWCMYLKGGSAQFLVEGCDFFNGGTGGFTAGQGTGFEFMTDPWLHYEAEDVKFVSNVVHDTAGAGVGVNGGYNILVAYNTLFRVGSRSHAIEITFGLRGCDGDSARCRDYLARGGWGTAERNDGTNEQPIPNRNVYVYDNVIYNPAGFASAYSHFFVPGPRTPAGFSNIPSPASADENLRIRGNVIWNGPADLPLGVEDAGAGCQTGNATCTEAQLRADNAINTVEPQFENPSILDLLPRAGGNLYSATVYAIPPFPGGDRPLAPAAPEGTLDNTVPRDLEGNARTSLGPPGAYLGDGSVPATFAMIGRIADGSGAPVPGVTIRFGLVSGSGATPADAVTRADGTWSQSGFGRGSVYRATPSGASGVTFDPASREFDDATDTVDFRASGGGGGMATTFGVSGVVARRNGPLEGVTMTFSSVAGGGAVPPPVSTDASGRWSQTGFEVGTTYRVTPSAAGWRFRPRSLVFDAATDTLGFRPRRR